MSLKFTAPAANEARPPQPPARSSMRGHLREYGMILSLAVIVIFFEKMTNGALLLPLNLTNLVLQNSYIVIMALGMLLVIVAGSALNITSLALTILLTVAMVGLGLRNRIKRQRNGISQDSALFFGLKNAVMAIIVLGLGYLLSSYRGLPNVLMIMIVLIALYTFVTLRTTIGRRIYALGGNEKAAKLSGIKTERLTFLTFVNMGVLSALAGLIFAARLNTATPKAGTSFELDVIAACFIGGASASGGVGKVTGAVIGAFVMGIMNNGMSIVGVGIDWQQVIKGLVLLAAVCFDVYNRNRS